MNKLSELFYSDVRAEILRLLFGLHPRRMYQAQIKRLTGFADRSIQEELDKLFKLDLVLDTKQANLRYYEANQANPIYGELRAIVLKTVGLHDLLAGALDSPQIDYAFIFGSVARLAERTDSDVDLMIIGTLGRREVTPMLRGLADQVGRQINFHVYTQEELRAKLAERNHFLIDVVTKPKLFIKGGEHEFAAMAGNQQVADHP